ncbi:MAG TPA: phasin family protein [Candidatus Sulfotelmatobacter sp.]|nr:phasin family protein [Candidatus Sulfotelmatobacter sp.]
MSKRPEALPFGFNFDTGLSPMAMFEPWLKVQAGMATTYKTMIDHWCARRTADLASLQEMAAQFAGCSTPQSLVEAQTKCASALAERVMADVTGLREDMMSLGSSAATALGGLGANGATKAPRAAAE